MSIELDKKRRKEILDEFLNDPDNKDDYYSMLNYLSKKFTGNFIDSFTSLRIFDEMITYYRIQDIVTPFEYYQMLKEAFTGYDTAKTLSADRRYEFLFCFFRNPSLMMNSDEINHLKTLPDIIKIYRGYRNGKRKGLSWTLSKEVAEFYAYNWNRREPAPGTVVSIKVPKNKIFAYLNEMKEEEVIVPLRIQKGFKIESKDRK